jgi:hypothetical protein
MTDLLPSRAGVARSRQLERATRAQEAGELEIFRHHITTRIVAECDRIDSEAVADVAKHALGEEMRVLDWGLAEAGDNFAKRELVGRMVNLQANIDNARIARRFGA